VSEFEAGLSDLGRFVTGRRGRVVVAALPSIAAVLLPGSISRFLAERPEVEFEILDAISGSVLDAVADGRAEIGLTARPMPGRDLVYEPLLSDDFGLVVRRDDPLAERPYCTWQVFAERPFIAMSSGSSVRAITDSAFVECGLAIAPLFSCGFLATTRALVHEGLGITALPGLTVPLMAESGLVWRPLIEPMRRRSLGYVRRAGATLSPAALDFMAAMRREIRQRERDASLLGGIRSDGEETPAG
jgi:DNA-binding transcriptional LysR family regulator